MNDMTKFLTNSGTHFGLINLIIAHINTTIANRNSGRKAKQNNLKIELDGNGPDISVSVMKQSIDKNDWFD